MESLTYVFERIVSRLVDIDPEESFRIADYAHIGDSSDTTDFLYGDRRYAVINGVVEGEPDAYYDGDEWLAPAHFASNHSEHPSL